MQPLSTVTTVTAAVWPHWRSVREQPVPLELQLCWYSSWADGFAVTTYQSACGAAVHVT